MFVAAVAALALGSCSFPYEKTGTITVRFPVGSAELSLDEDQKIAEALAPLIGNPLAEVELTTYFPYGDNEISPAFILAKSRFDRLRSRSAEVGISPDLVAGSISAAGWTYEGGEYLDVAYPADRLERVDVRFRVKTECHPLAELARSLDPYRTK